MSKMRANIIVLGLSSAATMLSLDLAKADQVGHASWYALHSRTASGEQMNPSAMTAAHRSLPFGTKVLVENLSNGRSVVVTINDRGPFVGGRIIDVSKAAASSLGMLGSGTANVRVTTAGGGGGAGGGRGFGSGLAGGFMGATPKLTQVSARQRSRRDEVAEAAPSKPPRIASRNGRNAAIMLASATHPYGGVVGDAPGFMKSSEMEPGRGARRSFTRLAYTD